MQPNNIYEKPLGYQQITSLSAAAGLTVPKGRKLILVTPESQAVRWRDDGTAPTVTGFIPAGYFARLRTVNVLSTPAFAYRAGQEVLL